MRTFGDKVRVEEKLASGGMGDVYRAKHLVTGADVAVKVLEPQAQPDEEAIERFRTEAHISALLAHPNIVRVFDMFDEPDGSHALVMELLIGQTLEERLRDGALDPLVAIAVVVPILAALDHAHAVGVVHRDVKPANIFLAVEPDGRVTPKLLDFGAAKSSASNVQTMDGRVLGTASYVSPEQARGAELDGRSDLFSTGVCLYEAITGEPLFSGKDAADTMTRVLEACVDPHERIPPRVWLVIQKSLAKAAYERYATAAEFARALESACGKTDDDLAKLLRSERPPLPKLQTPVVAIRPVSRRAIGKRVWPFAIAAAIVVAVGASFVSRHAARSVPTSGQAPIASASPSASSSIVATSREPTTSESASVAPVHPTPPSSHTKRIATTPGF